MGFWYYLGFGDEEETTALPSTGIPDLVKNSKMETDVEGEPDYGTITAIIISSVFAMVILMVVVGFFIYRQFIRGNSNTINFDNPVYRKTTVDPKDPAAAAVVTNNHRTYSSGTAADGETLEPLNRPGTNEFV